MQTPVQIVFHDAASRQIEEHAQKMRREVKHHANGQPASGKQTGEQQ